MSLRRLFWVSLALALAGVALMLSWSGPRVSAGGVAPFDIRQGGYSYDEAVRFLSALSAEGRAAYLGPQRLADTLFPVGLLGVLALGLFAALRVWSVQLAALAALVPAAYFICDMLENAAVAGLLSGGAEGITPADVARASAFTIWKFHFVNASLVLLAAALAARAARWIRRRRSA